MLHNPIQSKWWEVRGTIDKRNCLYAAHYFRFISSSFPGTLFQDFVVTSGPAEVDEIVEFGPGHLTAIFILNVTDDLIALESNESVILFMSEPSNPRVKLGIAESVVNIIDDDSKLLFKLKLPYRNVRMMDPFPVGSKVSTK